MLNHNLGSYQDHVKALGDDKFRGIPQPDAGRRHPGPGLQPRRRAGSVQVQSKNKTAAWKFIEFAVSHASNTKCNESAGADSVQHGGGEGRVDPDRPRRRSSAAEALNSGTIKIVQLPYYLPDWNTISKADNEPNFQKVLLKKMSAKDFLDTLAEQLNEAQAEWKEQTG